jgi:hypothetical protein
MSKRKQRPERLFKGKRLSPDLKRFIDALTPDPALRVVMYEAMTSIDHGDAVQVFASVGMGNRAGLLLAWRDAAIGLSNRKPCDFCSATARKVRFIVAFPGDDYRGVRHMEDGEALTGFCILCESCFRTPPDEAARKLLARYADIEEESGPMPHRQPAILGERVGEVAHLRPGRNALRDCGDCGKAIWVNQDERDQVVGPDGDDKRVTYLCVTCAAKRADDGQLECVPTHIFGTV